MDKRKEEVGCRMSDVRREGSRSSEVGREGCLKSNVGNCRGQVRYFISIMLIFIGFAFFGIFLIQNATLTGNVISNPSLPSSCEDVDIQAVWDSIFQESSIGISILKNNSLVGGNCAEYFANKSDANEVNFTYILYGYTKLESGENVSYVFAEKINATDGYILALNNINSIEDVAPLSLRDGTFLFNFVFPRAINITSISEAETEFDSIFETLRISLTADTFFGDESFSFVEDLSTETINIFSTGFVTANYSYNSFSFNSKAIECISDITCGDWSTCINDIQNRTCTNSSNCYVTSYYIENQSCDIYSCTPLWNWSDWSDCVNDIQLRTVWDENNCSSVLNKPLANKSCGVCVPNWSIGDWSDCVGGLQIRIVNDIMSCGDNTGKPIMNQSCSVALISTSNSTSTSTSGSSSKTGFDFLFVFVILIIVFIILGVAVWLLFLIKNKEEFNGVAKNNSYPANPSSKFPLMNKVVKPMQRIIPKQFRPSPKPIGSRVPISKKPVLQKSARKSFPRFSLKKVPPIPVKRNFGK